jgi:hypothetical protein
VLLVICRGGGDASEKASFWALYVHARAAITLFDEILESVFGERLASHLPERVLPISTKPIVDVDILIDEQYAQIEDLLKPGKRRRVEARAMLRGPLALEGHMAGDTLVSERDVNRVERAVRDGKKVSQGLPPPGRRRRHLHRRGARSEGALHEAGLARLSPSSLPTIPARPPRSERSTWSANII